LDGATDGPEGRLESAPQMHCQLYKPIPASTSFNDRVLNALYSAVPSNGHKPSVPDTLQSAGMDVT
jgi:hypothetical protein